MCEATFHALKPEELMKFKKDLRVEMRTETADFTERVRVNQQKLTRLELNKRKVGPSGALNVEYLVLQVTLNSHTPLSDCDPYTDEALTSPWDIYTELRALGSSVWLTRYQMFALTRYDSVERALKDATTFSSASGVMMNDDMNRVLRGNTLCSDDPDHQRLRRIVAKPLSSNALKALSDEITQ